MKTTPLLQDVFLLGGGHAHALVINQWRMNPIAGVRLTLISPDTHTPYSGMLPGLLAGIYSFEQTHIDLDHLCAAANVRFIRAASSGLDLVQKAVLFADRPPLEFDLLSINTGASPNLSVPGSAEFTLPVKPISALYPRWQHLLTELTLKPESKIAVVGGGAAAVELGAAIKRQAPKAKLTLYFPEAMPLQGYANTFRQRVTKQLQQMGIALAAQRKIATVEPNVLIDDAGIKHNADTIFWCAEASAPIWLAQAGLAVDSKGFVQVNRHLQSLSHNFVFAAGDIAALVDQSRPKAGVFAVREAPILFRNLCAFITQKPLVQYRAQKSFLSILSLADGTAMASRAGGFLPTFSGAWVWRWKDKIDRKFMAKFRHTTPMTAPAESVIDPALWGERPPSHSALAMRCGGCGAKVGANILAGVVSQLTTVQQPNVIIGLDQPDDAAAIRFTADTTLIQSVDQFRVILDDPFVQGKIAALHALSDLHAMHAAPHSAQALVTLPFARDAITQRDLTQLMAGSLNILNKENCQLTGGHTSEGLEASIGFAVNGIAQTPLLTKAGLRVGDHLIMTQPLGTGVLFAARAQLFSQGQWIQNALDFMLQSNQHAANILSSAGASSCTDVTGFGLAGHLMEMLRASQLSAQVQLSKIGFLDGAIECASAHIGSSLKDSNLIASAGIADADEWLNDPRVQLLFDPQTAGGLLAGVPASDSNTIVDNLKQAGYQASCIGEITSAQTHLIRLIR